MVNIETDIIELTIKKRKKVFIPVFTVKKFKTPLISKTATGSEIKQAQNTSLIYCFVNRNIMV